MKRPDISQQELTIIWGHVIANHKPDVIYILQRNGVNVPESISDRNLIRATISAVEHSDRVREELAQLFTQAVVNDDKENFTDPDWATDYLENPDSFGLDGHYNNTGPLVYNPNPSPGYAQPGGDPSNPSTANWGNDPSGGGSFWSKISSETINSVVNFGLNAVGSSLNKKQSEKEHQQTMDQLEAQIALAAQQQTGGKPKGGTGLSPLAVAGIAAGGLAVIVVIALAVRKKK